MFKILIIIILIYFAYCIIPTFYYKWFKTKAVKNLGDTNNIALTFDDGIDKIYTEKLLDVLNKYNIKATFFIVAKTAEENPKTIKRMIKEGHTIGLHSLEHKDALLKGYFYTKKDFKTSIEIMKNHGLNIKYYRPPWGHMNIFTLKYIKNHRLQLILWNIMVGDWKDYSSSERIENKLIKNISKGSIICLHDGRGTNDAPKRTIQALDTVIPQLIEKGFNFVTMEQIYG
ncbi:polysaccharide deacetylase family protein [Wansuia hejianensis]|uniref:Polysaccharide deacetylase family protein n=1 Tax=Wansuia hejianensis TaxID=2763667 RepID=A0A926EUZ6_9FIRM|nr:polysaccharide deacetylase family protein [Wansuia hejianensis]MBC8590343.1 polysaccharide deacetylase family protein [Wansuia hejianensis]